MSVILDIIAIVIITASILYGWRKGLILTIAGVIITIVSLAASWGIATAFTPMFSQVIETNLMPTINEALNAAAVGSDMLPDLSAITDGRITAATQEAVSSLGFGGNNNAITSAINRKIQETGLSVRDATASTICRAVAFSGLFIFSFLILRAVLEFAAHFVSKIFKLPGLNLINSLGGIGVGLLHGILMLSIIGWSLQFAGMIISAEEVAQTQVMRHFTNSWLLDWLSNALAQKL
jgi:uncharacterized membrane protein required for colicin V production